MDDAEVKIEQQSKIVKNLIENFYPKEHENSVQKNAICSRILSFIKAPDFKEQQKIKTLTHALNERLQLEKITPAKQKQAAAKLFRTLGKVVRGALNSSMMVKSPLMLDSLPVPVAACKNLMKLKILREHLSMYHLDYSVSCV